MRLPPAIFRYLPALFTAILFLPVMFILHIFILDKPAKTAPEASLPRVTPQIIKVLPHNSQHFTQGLFFHGGQLFESTGLHGRSVLARKSQNGASLAELPLPREYFGEGACSAHGNIYWLTWKAGICFIIDPDTLNIVNKFQYQGEGWGLTFDGQRLIRSDGTSTLHLHAQDGAPIGQINVMAESAPLTGINELEWLPEQELLLANIWFSPLVAIIKLPENQLQAGQLQESAEQESAGQVAQVIFWLDLRTLIPPGLPNEAVANGLAIAPNGQSLYLTGKLWPILYQIAWPQLPAPTTCPNYLRETKNLHWL